MNSRTIIFHSLLSIILISSISCKPKTELTVISHNVLAYAGHPDSVWITNNDIVVNIHMGFPGPFYLILTFIILGISIKIIQRNLHIYFSDILGVPLLKLLRDLFLLLQVTFVQIGEEFSGKKPGWQKFNMLRRT